jgi:hypothetical protein
MLAFVEIYTSDYSNLPDSANETPIRAPISSTLFASDAGPNRIGYDKLRREEAR